MVMLLRFAPVDDLGQLCLTVHLARLREFQVSVNRSVLCLIRRLAVSVESLVRIAAPAFGGRAIPNGTFGIALSLVCITVHMQ